MKKYIYYGEIQRRLNRHSAETGQVIGFAGAMAELAAEGQFHTGKSLPPASFLEWDVRDIPAFSAFMDRVPVDLDAISPPRSGGGGNVAVIHPIKIAENQAMGLHTSPFFDIVYVLIGRSRLYLDGTLQQVQAGDFYVISPHFRRDIVAEKGSILISIGFSEDTIEDTLYLLLQSENIVSDFFRANLDRGGGGFLRFHLLPTEQMLAVIRSIFHEAHSGEPFSNQLCINYIEVLFSYLLRECAANYQWFRKTPADRLGVSILPVVRYIRENYRNVTLADAGRRFGYEPGYLSKRLKAQTGKNFSELICLERLREAKRLLRSTPRSIREIAEETGYSSAAYFCQSFRKSTGMSPSAYRTMESGAERGETTPEN